MTEKWFMTKTAETTLLAKVQCQLPQKVICVNKHG